MDKFAQVKTLLIVLVVVAGLGFIDAGYLTTVKFIGIAPSCGEFGSCDSVTSSAYATIGPIPVALLGALYYLTIGLLAIFALDRRSVRVAKLASKLTLVGLIASVYFVFLQLFILKSICVYCMVSALSSTLLFIIGMMLLSKLKKGADQNTPELHPN